MRMLTGMASARGRARASRLYLTDIYSGSARDPLHAVRHPGIAPYRAHVGLRDPEGAPIERRFLLERELRPDLSGAPRARGKPLDARPGGQPQGRAAPHDVRDHATGPRGVRAVASGAPARRAASKRAAPQALLGRPRVSGRARIVDPAAARG